MGAGEAMAFTFSLIQFWTSVLKDCSILFPWLPPPKLNCDEIQMVLLDNVQQIKNLWKQLFGEYRGWVFTSTLTVVENRNQTYNTALTTKGTLKWLPIELLSLLWRALEQVCKNLTRVLHSTEKAFLLPTQQPRVWIPAPPRFFSLLLSLR